MGRCSKRDQSSEGSVLSLHSQDQELFITVLIKKMVDLFNCSVEERDDQLVEEPNLLAGHPLTEACAVVVPSTSGSI
jgi:hypothetical protein